jgi:dienelactone hydrolase
MRVAALLIALLSTTAMAALPPPERVRFESRDAGVVIEGLLYRPPLATARPAIVALHGCGGLYRRDQPHVLASRHAAQAEAWLAAGYVVLFPDSFRSRGVEEVCTLRSSDRSIRPRERRLDALGALRYLSAQRYVARDRIALVGWSHGGSTVLATIDGNDAVVAAFVAPFDAPPFFRSAIAFYPGCAPSLRNERWRPVVPTRILIGDADDWTPSQPCVFLAARARERGWPVETNVYAGAHHGFDGPGRGGVRHRTDVPNGVSPGKGVHVGPDPAAREDAQRRMADFLRETLGR